MSVSRAIAVFTALLTAAAGCAGNDPAPENVAGVGGSVVGPPGGTTGGGAGTMGGAGIGSAGTMAGTSGVGGLAGTIAAGMGGMPASGAGGANAGGTGASGAGGMDGSMMPDGEGTFFPLATGNSWTFRVTDAGTVSMKTQTVGALEAVGGMGPNKDAMAYKLTTTKSDGADKTESWQVEVDNKIVRYRELSYMATGGALELEEHWDPYKLRIDMTPEHLMQGATWTETAMETKLPVGMTPTTATTMDTWRVVASNEMVTVPAGTFNAIVLEKTGGTSIKRYWFVRKVGKVKETGTQTEELTAYTVME